MDHKAGFVNIIGRPNVGKSTLLNRIAGQKLAIVTSKAQTTRHRIMAIVNDENFQIVFSDTPGIIKPHYKLHEKMMGSVQNALEDADILLLMTDIYQKPDDIDEFHEFSTAIKRLNTENTPVILVLNKIDKLKNEDDLKELAEKWKDKLSKLKKENASMEIVAVSAIKGLNVDVLMQIILEKLPVSPPYYDKDALTDRPERFFVSEIIREKVFLQFKKEIPYSTEVVIHAFVEEENIIKIEAEILVLRKTQKGILIGKGGQAIKKLGIESRKDIEDFLGKRVHLALRVKVKEDWRDKDAFLTNLGYS